MARMHRIASIAKTTAGMFVLIGLAFSPPLFNENSAARREGLTFIVLWWGGLTLFASLLVAGFMEFFGNGRK